MRQRRSHLAGLLASRVPLLACVAMLALVTVLAFGCADTPSTATSQPGDALLRDPMNYRPSSDDFPDVSGGGLGHFDKKGFNRDLNNVLNP